MADQELTQLELLTVLASGDLLLVRDVSAGKDKQVAASAFLGLLPPKFLDDLGDVDTTTTAPSTGDHLEFDGTLWVPAAPPAAAGPHAPTHESGGTDVIDGDVLDISFTPGVYTPALAPPFTTALFELTSHLAGIDIALGGLSPLVHTHTESDITDLAHVISLQDEGIAVTATPHGTLNFVGSGVAVANAGAGVATITITGGITTFLGHTDTPGSYAGAGSFFVKVNSGATALEFVADPGFLIDITGEALNDLSDVVLTTPATGEFLRFNGTNWVNATISLSDLPALSLDDLSDVDTTTTPPISGDMLSFNGTVWVPASGMAPGAHASTHISAGTDEIDGDRLDIDFVPTNYTRDTTPAEVTLVVELTAHLKGIDNALVGGATTFLSHTDTPGSYTGAAGQFVKVNATPDALVFAALALGDLPAIAINDLSDVTITGVALGELLAFTGTIWENQTLAEVGVAPAVHTHVEADITDLAHVTTLQDEGITVTATPHGTLNFVGAGVAVTDAGAGIATITISGGAGAAAIYDRQEAFAGTTATTTSVTFVDVPGMSLTTKDLGSAQAGNYIVLFSAVVSHQTQKEFITFQILVDGVVKATSRVTLNFSNADVDSNLVHLEASVIVGKNIKIQWHQSKVGGQNQASIIERALVIHGVPSADVVV